MKKITFTIAFLLLSSLLCSAANTSCEKPFNSARANFYIRTGPAFLIGPVPNVVEPIFGIGYEVPLHANKNPIHQTMIGFSLDYVPVNSDVNGTVSTMPELFYVKWTGLNDNPHAYAAVGVGARWSSEDMPEMQLHVDQNPCWSITGGYDFSKNWFGEVRFIGGWRPWKDGLFALEVGYRF